jgi:hypothetical protein
MKGSNRGIHWSASTDHANALANWPYWSSELAAMFISWVKLLDNGAGSSRQMCEALLSRGISPIVRLYRPRPNPGQLQTLSSILRRQPEPVLSAASVTNTVGGLIALGVRYFETTNEPNLRDEWNYADWQMNSLTKRVDMVMDSWIRDADKIITLGGVPCFPALAQCGHADLPEATGSIRWYIEAVRYLAEKYPRAAMDILPRSVLAVHNYGGNHPPSYPYDPINHADHPTDTIFQDDFCIRAYEVIDELVHETFGLDLPILCTEGGYVPPNDGWERKDTRYDALTYDSQARLTVAAYSWIAEHNPRVLAICPWLIANERMGHFDTSWTKSVWYYQGGERPVVQTMKEAIVPEPIDPKPVIRNAGWNARGIAYNPDAAFPKRARELEMGAPLTGEFDVVVNGKTYRAQGFVDSLLYCEVGDWDNIKTLGW